VYHPKFGDDPSKLLTHTDWLQDERRFPPQATSAPGEHYLADGLFSAKKPASSKQVQSKQWMPAETVSCFRVHNRFYLSGLLNIPVPRSSRLASTEKQPQK